MLYKLKSSEHKISDLEPLSFLDFADLGRYEKDLEILLANHLLDVLFEDAVLMAISQERPMQAEADIYALNSSGDLIIFELKRGITGPDAMLQILRYAQDAGLWTFNTLEEKYGLYCGNSSASLAEAHREAFNLERSLLPSEFNRRQHSIIVGNAANVPLIDAVDYWKKQGLSVDFLPYRIYNISNEHYFEFFALPYDRHQNPSLTKGVIFDTNRSWDEDSIWEMMEQNRVAAYGSIKHVVDYLNPRDMVFFSHKWVGLIAAAEVVGRSKNDGPDERYKDVKFLTPKPIRTEGIVKFMPFSEVSNITGRSFFWARTIKVPYLTKDESQLLLGELKKALS